MVSLQSDMLMLRSKVDKERYFQNEKSIYMCYPLKDETVKLTKTSKTTILS